MIAYCVWHMSRYVPPTSNKVDQSSLKYHEKAAGTFNEELTKDSAPLPHAH
jgi:hypothetical protein